MPQFEVDDDLAALVWLLAKPKPFENLTFGAALRRVLQAPASVAGTHADEDPLDAHLRGALGAPKSEPKKAPTPSPFEWVSTVPELKNRKELTSWKSICDLLKIDTAGDSARRKLRNWVKQNRPSWPAVPDIE